MGYSYEIMTDSTANLPETMIEQYGLHVLSMSFMIDNKEYKGYEKGKTIDLAKFYAMMREKKDVSTSLANTQEAYDLVKKVAEQGKDLIYIGFSSGLSSTFQAVKTAFEDLKEEFPKRKLYCLDSLAAALGEGLFVHYIIQMREQGKTIEEAYEWGLAHRLNICHAFTVDDLFFLKRGGRVSGATAIIGTALNVKPVLHVDDEGHLIPLFNVRGRKKSLDSLVKRMEETVEQPDGQVIYIIHGDCEEDAKYVAQKVRDKFNVGEIMIRVLDPVIGAHSGPGTVALFYYGSQR